MLPGYATGETLIARSALVTALAATALTTLVPTGAGARAHLDPSR
ncbi:hypothetical protein [Nonomuraea recticatena]|uniref:Uncharacterized protein n=1 Tax=Nonomuraea recticatena TaxID=46178 RepID=A0ABN3SKQ7_9ACTN